MTSAAVIEKIEAAGVNPLTGKRRPGFVHFAGGTKLSTFDAVVIAQAAAGVGQLAEYTTSMNGQYVNLASIRLLGGAGATPSISPIGAVNSTPGTLYQIAAPAPGGLDVILTSIRELSGSIRELTSAVQRAGGAKTATLPAAAPQAEQAEQDAPTSLSPFQLVVNRLIAALGPEVAEKYIQSLQKKHKDPGKLLAAAEAVAAANEA